MRNAESLTKSEKRKICLIILHGIIVIGILLGAYTAASLGAAKTEGLPWLHQFVAPIFSGNKILTIFRNTFVVSAVFSAAAFILGFFSFGQPLAAALLILRGMGIGASASLMYMTFGAEALSAVLVLILPKAACLSFIAALSVRESFKMSGFLLGFLMDKEHCGDPGRKILKLYIIKFAVIVAAAAIIAIPDSLITHWFTSAN